MNHLLYAIPLFLLAAPVFAGETIRPNPFIDGQYDIFDDGKRVGTIRENPFIDGQLDVEDGAGHRTETIRRNPFIDGQYDVESHRPRNAR